MRICDLNELRARGIYFIDSWQSNRAVLTPGGFVDEALKLPLFSKKLLPCVIDLAKLERSLQAVKDRDLAVLSARVKIFGTDGVRGVVSLERPSSGKNFLQMFSSGNKLTPDLVRNTALAFASALLASGRAKKGDTVLAGEDGRDYFDGKPFKSALIDGLCLGGFEVADAGVIATPGLPIIMAVKKYKAAAMLTASHNPSNQNGVKFFVNGFKVLPEGVCGDYAITAGVYAQLFGMERAAAARSSGRALYESGSIYTEVTAGAVPFKEGLKGLELVFDPANGAGTVFGKRVFKALHIKARCVNDDPRGDNINQGGGVALLEGVEKFDHSENLKHLPSAVREMIEKEIAFGIVLDGDGDRCYLLANNNLRKAVYVINGDKLSFIIAKHLKASVPGGIFINTVESDLMAALSAEKELGLQTRMACVGDKWVVQALHAGEKMLVGAEESGHIVVPIRAGGKTVYCGNGIFTGILALSLIKHYGSTMKEICSPYDEGFQKTFYTYIVEKTLFQRGSAVFEADREIAAAEFKKSKKDMNLDGELEEKVFENDPDMLYLRAKSGKNGDVAGAIFARNSGTENKTGVYIRCIPAFSGIMLNVALKLVEHHRKSLKDRGNPDTALEKETLRLLAAGNGLKLQDLRRPHHFGEAHLKAFLYGMAKEYPDYKAEIMKILS